MNHPPASNLRPADIRRNNNVGTEFEIEVLYGISIARQHAEFVALTGLPGLGKSTRLNIIGLLERPTSGVLEIAGQKTQSLDDTGLTKLRGATIGFVFQFHHPLLVFSVARMDPVQAIRA